MANVCRISQPKKKRVKQIFSISLFIAHIALFVYFLSLDYGYLSEHKAMRVILFICPAFILPSINNELRAESDNRWQLLIYSLHNLFSMIVGTVYALYYTGVIFYITKSLLIIGSFIFLAIFIAIIQNLIRYGFLGKRKE